MDQVSDLLFLMCGWFVYYSFHSVFASETVKGWTHQKLPAIWKRYRLIYSVLATIGLFLMLYWNGSIPSAYLLERTTTVRYSSYVISAIGVIIIRIAFKEYDLGGFLGFQDEEKSFRRSGILERVRHPIYTGLILILLGFFLFTPTLPTLVSVGCSFIYLVIGIYLEEKKLISQFGDQYLKYKVEVPMLFPRLW